MPGAASPRNGQAARRRRWHRARPGPPRRAPGGRRASALTPRAARRLAVPGGVRTATAPRRGGRRRLRFGPVPERRGRRDLLGEPLPGRGIVVQVRRDTQGGFGAGPAVAGVIMSTERVGCHAPGGHRVACLGLVAVLVVSTAVPLGAPGAGGGHAGQGGLRPPPAASRPGLLGALLLFSAPGALFLGAPGAGFLGAPGAGGAASLVSGLPSRVADQPPAASARTR